MDSTALEAAARAQLSEQAYDYYAGGADDERTLADNEAAWLRLRLRPRVLRDVSAVSTATTVLGTAVAMPALVAPTAAHRMAHPDGEAATARGAAAAKTLMVLSTLATVSLEDVAAAAPDAPRWYQLYVRRDRGWSAELVARAEAAGYRAIVLTVDLPVLGHRRRDDRHPPGLPEGIELVHFASRGREDEQWLASTAQDDLDPSLSFADLEWVAGLSSLPVVVKGILRGDDARACLDAGAAAVVVSNHGGRQLDTAVSGADALPDVVEAIDGAIEVFVDGGIRRGSDVVKALALGARAVLVGRPVLWGLATDGAAGVQAVLDGLRADLERSMALCGAVDVDGLDRSLLAAGRGGRAGLR